MFEESEQALAAVESMDDVFHGVNGDYKRQV